MHRHSALILVALLATTNVHADYDAALEAQEQAARQAEEAKQAAADREAQQMRAAAEAKAHAELMASYRKSLGAAAAGKSDAELMQLMQQRQQSAMDDASKAAAQAAAAMADPRNAAALQSVTGKTMEQVQNMSDADAEALAREMEKKYGGQ